MTIMVHDMKRGRRPYWRSIRTYWYWFAILALLIFQWYVYPPMPGPPPRPTGSDVSPKACIACSAWSMATRC